MSTRTRRGRRATTLIAACTVGALTLAACGSSSDEAATETTAESLKIALSAQPQASLVPLVYGVDNYGADFDLDISVDNNVTIFDSHATAAQTVLGGQAQVMGSSISSILAARQQGEDFKIFCPYVSMDDFVLTGANGVTTVAQLFEPSTRVAIDSPGGAGAIILNALLMGVGESRSIQEIPTQQIIESSSLRTAAWAAGDVDSTVIHEDQYESAEADVDQPVRIATLYENVDTFIKEAQAADAAWLEQNRELAAKYCATTLRAMKELKGDFALFQTAVNEYVEEPPSEEELRVLFDLIEKYSFWTDDGGLTDESMQFMIEVATASGVLTEPMNAADVVDRETLNRAVELANQPAT
jgi:ABC-type nitrate/sulfonate/bicarbonate transport system substrate-binding protein